MDTTIDTTSIYSLQNTNVFAIYKPTLDFIQNVHFI